MLVDSIEYDGNAVCEVGDVGCFYLFIHNVQLTSSIYAHADGPSFVQHNADTFISQESYIQPSVTQAAKNTLDIWFVPFSPPHLYPPH